jgi:hypothetical protein
VQSELKEADFTAKVLELREERESDRFGSDCKGS